MPYSEMNPEQQCQLREYVGTAHELFSTVRDSKETMAFAGLAVFLGAVATVLVSHDWPPAYARDRPWLIVSAFSALWLFVAFYLRYQLRRRRWAALRVSGCDWLLAEWLPDSPRAMACEQKVPTWPANPELRLKLFDLLWPLNGAVIAIDPDPSRDRKRGTNPARPRECALHVYPTEIETAWLLAADRGTDALLHERIIHAAGWVGYAAVVARTLLPHSA